MKAMAIITDIIVMLSLLFVCGLAMRGEVLKFINLLPLINLLLLIFFVIFCVFVTIFAFKRK